MRRKKTAALLAGILLTETLLTGACGSVSANVGNGRDTAGSEMPAADGQAEERQKETAMERQKETATERQDAENGREKADGQQETAQEENRGAQVQYEDGANGFALRLSRTVLSGKEEGQNLLLSPYSIWLPLAALGNAADGAVQKELLGALGKAGYDVEKLNEEVKSAIAPPAGEKETEWAAENGQESESPLKIANALFLDRDLHAQPEFETVFADCYGGKLFSVNFADDAAVEAVNEWAKENTEGRIDRIIEDFDPQTAAAIANAVCFSDSWTAEFSKEDTRNDTFHGTGGDREVPFMNRKFAEMPYYEDETVQIAVLSTKRGGQLKLLLPRDGHTAEEVLKGMSLEKLDSCEYRTVQLSLPRFRLESETFSLKESLEMMGIPLFDRKESPEMAEDPHFDRKEGTEMAETSPLDGQKLPLTGLAREEALFLSDAVQKAVLEVDEEGMTAAAVTLVMMSRGSMKSVDEPVEMKCDRPFAFVLTANVGEQQQILFTGVVNRIES